MARSSKRNDYVSILEACYASTDRDDTWLEELLRTACPALDLGGGIGLSLVREGVTDRSIVLSKGIGPLAHMVELSWPVIRYADRETYQKFFYPKEATSLASTLVAGFAKPYRIAFAGLMAAAGAKDVYGMVGYPAAGWAFAMFVAVDKLAISPSVRETLRRLRIHIEASLRLRVLSSAESVAVLRPDGKLEHLTLHAADASVQEALTAHTCAIEQARGKSRLDDPEGAVALWQALVEGRWSLVERVDSDGKRLYHAFENAPHTHAYRALTETESTVLGLSLQGMSGKEVAYATGLSQSRISSALGLAASRLGFANREELLRVGVSLLHQEADITSAELTSAEREVLALARRGLSNREIAEARSTSIHTVANQMAALLRKTGLGNRRALVITADLHP